jgi:hypothetical protein
MGNVEFFITNYQLPEPVEPGMTQLNDPTPRFETWGSLFFNFFFTSWTDMWRVPGSNHYLPRPFTGKGRIGTKMFLFFFFILRCGCDDSPSQNGCKLADIMPVRSGYDDGQRDATPFHKQMSFASFFFPDPWGLPRNFPVPAGLCTYSHL